MSPAAHALDRRLLELRSEHEVHTTRLAELEADPTYRRLVDGHGMTGTTAERVLPAMAKVSGLRPALDTLGQLVERVGAARGWGTLDDAVATALFAQLNAPTLAFAAEPQGVTPHRLLTLVDEATAALQAVVADATRVWAEIDGRLADARAEAGRLASTLPGFPIVVAAREALEGLAERAERDPLGAVDDLTTVESALATAAGAGDEIDRLHDQMVIATRTMEELETLVGEGRNGLALARAELSTPDGLLDPVDPQVLTGERGLRPWLGRLEALVAKSELALAAKGLESWSALADKTLATARQVAEANSRPPKRRRELRSLLRAARVKAGASGRAEDPVMEQLYRRAEAALAVPCCLATAEAEVEAFMVELRRSPTPEQARRTAPVPVVTGGTAPWGAPAPTEIPGGAPAPGRGEVSRPSGPGARPGTGPAADGAAPAAQAHGPGPTADGAAAAQGQGPAPTAGLGAAPATTAAPVAPGPGPGSATGGSGRATGPGRGAGPVHPPGADRSTPSRAFGRRRELTA
jgi:hypothetical protein